MGKTTRFSLSVRRPLGVTATRRRGVSDVGCRALLCLDARTKRYSITVVDTRSSDTAILKYYDGSTRCYARPLGRRAAEVRVDDGREFLERNKKPPDRYRRCPRASARACAQRRCKIGVGGREGGSKCGRNKFELRSVVNSVVVGTLKRRIFLVRRYSFFK